MNPNPFRLSGHGFVQANHERADLYRRNKVNPKLASTAIIVLIEAHLAEDRNELIASCINDYSPVLKTGLAGGSKTTD
jgi:hypothetical protein